MVRYEELKNDMEIITLLEEGNKNTNGISKIDHSINHCMIVAEKGATILKLLGYDQHLQELVKIIGFLHDIGYAVNQERYAEFGAILAYQLIVQRGMPIGDAADVMFAIGNQDHCESINDSLSAALVIADKTDVRRSRIMKKESSQVDVSCLVNEAVLRSSLRIDAEHRVICLDLQIDNKLCSMYDYFQIFLDRMIICKRASKQLKSSFAITVNGIKML